MSTTQPLNLANLYKLSLWVSLSLNLNDPATLKSLECFCGHVTFPLLLQPLLSNYAGWELKLKPKELANLTLQKP